MTESVQLDVSVDGIATLTLNRPEKHNALNAEMISALNAMLDRLAEDQNIRVLVLTGRGRSFCAGGDLNWFRELVTENRAGRIARSKVISDLVRKLHVFPKPVIGRINGNAFGAGTGLLAACDIAIATADARFSIGETRMGLVAGTVAPFVIGRIGPAKARTIMLSGAPFDAAQAERIGLLDQVVLSDAERDALVDQVARAHLAAAPAALSRTKQMIRQVAELPLDEACTEASEAIADGWESGEAQARLDNL